jgi:hypothetical protein
VAGDGQYAPTVDDVVATHHLGHVLDPPSGTSWNLADRSRRGATIADIGATIRSAGPPFVDKAISTLTSPNSSPASLDGLVDMVALVEYYVRAGLRPDAAAVVRRLLESRQPRGRDHFATLVQRFRLSGLPDVQMQGAPNALACLTVRFDLPVETESV